MLGVSPDWKWARQKSWPPGGTKNSANKIKKAYSKMRRGNGYKLQQKKFQLDRRKKIAM